MALQRGKNKIQLPSGSNISINTPETNLFTPIIDTAMNYVADKVDRENTFKADAHKAELAKIDLETKELEYQKRVDQKNLTEIERRIAEDEKARLQAIKNQEKEAKKKFNNMEKQNSHRGYTLALMQLQNFSLDKQNEFWNNPKAYSEAMKEYFQKNYDNINNYVDADGLLQHDYSLDYLTQYNSIYNTAYAGIIEDYSKDIAVADKEVLLKLKNNSMQHFAEGVQFITDVTSLIQHNMLWMGQMSTLEEAYKTYNKAHDKYSQMTMEEYADEIHIPMLVNHDTSILTHALTSEKFGLFNGTLESLDDNELILQLWSSTYRAVDDNGALDKKQFNQVADALLVGIPEDRVEKIKKFAGVLALNTHHQWGFEEEQEILDDVRQVMSNKRKEVEANIKIETSVTNNQNKDWVNNIDWENLAYNIPTEEQLYKHSTKIDPNGDLVHDGDQFIELMKKRNDRIQLDNSAHEMIQGNTLKAINLLNDTEYSKDAIVNSKEHAFRLTFGEDFDTIGNFNNLAKSIISEGEMPMPDNVQAVLNMMQQQEYFPKDFVATATLFTGINVTGKEAEMGMLMDLATVYNYMNQNVDGLTIWNLDKNVARALDETYKAYVAGGQSATLGAEAWDKIMSPDKEQVRINTELVDKFLLDNFEVYEQFEEQFNEANAGTEFFSTNYWLGWAGTALGLNDVELENLMRDKTTFFAGYWSNMQIQPSAFKEFKKIVREKMIQSTAGMSNIDERTLNGMIDNVVWESILDMSDNNYAISDMAFDPNTKGGPILMEANKTPEAITGQNKENLGTNALAFMAQIFQTQDADELASMIGLDANSDEAGTWMTNMYDLVDEGKIKLQYNPSSNDKGAEEFYIWFKNGEDIWTTLKQDGVPVSWVPNNRFMINMGYTRTIKLNEMADTIARQNTDKYFSNENKSLWAVEGTMYPNTEEGRNAFYENEKWLQRNILLPMADKWETIKDNWASYDDKVANTISEQITKILTEVDISIQNEQQQLNENFNTNDLIFTFYSQFADNLDLRDPNNITLLKEKFGYDDETIRLMVEGKKGLNQEEKLSIIARDVENNMFEIQQIYANFPEVIHPAQAFVLQDIVNVVGDTSKVNEDSHIYKALREGNFSLALKHIKLLRPYFEDESRLNALVNMWGYNRGN